MIPSPDIFACLTSDTRNYSLVIAQPLGEQLMIEQLKSGEIAKSHEIITSLKQAAVNKIFVSHESRVLYKSIRAAITHRVTLLDLRKDPDPISAAQILQMKYKDFTLVFPSKEVQDLYVKTTTRKFDPKDLPIVIKGLFILVPYLLQHPGNHYAQIHPPGVIL